MSPVVCGLAGPGENAEKTQGRLPNAVRIDGCPSVVASRRRFGDWEGDTIVGRAHRGGLLSLVERKSGFTLLARVNDRLRRHSSARLPKNVSRCCPMHSAARSRLTTARNSPSMSS